MILHEEDELWTPEMESFEACAERGYLGLEWLMGRPEEHIFLVGHGGILRYMMNLHPHIQLRDQRTGPRERPVDSRFDNCELRRYVMSWEEEEEEESDSPRNTPPQEHSAEHHRRTIVLTQVDL